MRIINRTTKPIRILDIDGNAHTFPPVGPPVTLQYDVEGEVFQGFNIRRYIPVGVNHLPPMDEDILYVVAAVVARYVKRADLLAANTFHGAVRNEQGRIYATSGFEAFDEPV